MAERKRRRRSRRLRLRRGEVIAGAGAIALFVLLFFPWYDVELTGSRLSLTGEAGIGRSAWETLDVIAPLLALAAVLTLGVVLMRLLSRGWKPAIAPGAAVAVLGGLATLLALLRVLVPPDLGELGGIDYDVNAGLASFLGIAATLGIAVGGYRAMREEGSSFAAVADSLQPRPGRSASRKR